jgi:hypothetical protein
MTERTYYVIEWLDNEVWNQVGDIHSVTDPLVAEVVAHSVSHTLRQLMQLIPDKVGTVRVVKVEEKRTIMDQSYKIYDG